MKNKIFSFAVIFLAVFGLAFSVLGTSSALAAVIPGPPVIISGPTVSFLPNKVGNYPGMLNAKISWTTNIESTSEVTYLFNGLDGTAVPNVKCLWDNPNLDVITIQKDEDGTDNDGNFQGKKNHEIILTNINPSSLFYDPTKPKSVNNFLAKYQFCVKSADYRNDSQTFGSDVTSSTASFTVPSNASLSPLTITNVAHTVNNETSADISWGTPNHNTVRNTVYYSTNSSFLITDSATKKAGNLINNSYVGLRGLSPGTTYYYLVESVNNLGATARTSTPGVFKTRMSQVRISGGPIVVNLVDVSSREMQTNIRWTTNVSSRSIVYYSTAPFQTFYSATALDNIGTIPASGVSRVESASYGFKHSVSLSNLGPNTTYYFRVVSNYPVGTDGSGVISTQESFVTRRADGSGGVNLKITNLNKDTVLIIRVPADSPTSYIWNMGNKIFSYLKTFNTAAVSLSGASYPPCSVITVNATCTVSVTPAGQSNINVTDSTAIAGRYIYKVYLGGAGAPSFEIPITVTSPSIVPPPSPVTISAPINLIKVGSSATSTRFSWSSSGSGLKYAVYRAGGFNIDGSPATLPATSNVYATNLPRCVSATLVPCFAGTVSILNYIDTNITPSVYYNYRIVAGNGTSSSSPSTDLSVGTFTQGSDAQPDSGDGDGGSDTVATDYSSLSIESLNSELLNTIKKDEEERLKSKGLIGKGLFALRKSAGVPEDLTPVSASQVDAMLTERAKKMEELIKTDPDKFLELAEKSQSMVESISKYSSVKSKAGTVSGFEQKISITDAEVHVGHVDDFYKSENVTYNYSLSSEGKVQSFVPVGSAPLSSSGKGAVKGYGLGNKIVGTYMGKSTTDSVGSQIDRRRYQMRVLVVPLNLGKNEPVVTKQQIIDEYLAIGKSGDIGKIFTDFSYGNFNINFKVSDWVDVPGYKKSSYEPCEQLNNIGHLDSIFRQPVLHGEVDSGNFDTILFLVSTPGCFTGGMTGMGEWSKLNYLGQKLYLSNVTINQNVNRTRKGIVHELGHNLALPHASTISCTKDHIYDSECVQTSGDEYGNTFDNMGGGSAWGHFNAAFKYGLGWLNNDRLLELDYKSGKRYDITLTALNVNQAGIKAVKLNYPDPIYLEFRNKDAPTYVDGPFLKNETEGVFLNRAVAGPYTVDTTTLLRFGDISPLSGRVKFIEDKERKFKVSLIEISSDDKTAQIEIQFGDESTSAPIFYPKKPGIGIPTDFQGIVTKDDDKRPRVTLSWTQPEGFSIEPLLDDWGFIILRGVVSGGVSADISKMDLITDNRCEFIVDKTKPCYLPAWAIKDAAYFKDGRYFKLDTDVNNGIEYFYQIRAVGQEANGLRVASGLSKEIRVRTPLDIDYKISSTDVLLSKSYIQGRDVVSKAILKINLLSEISKSEKINFDVPKLSISPATDAIIVESNGSSCFLGSVSSKGEIKCLVKFKVLKEVNVGKYTIKIPVSIGGVEKEAIVKLKIR